MCRSRASAGQRGLLSRSAQAYAVGRAAGGLRDRQRPASAWSDVRVGAAIPLWAEQMLCELSSPEVQLCMLYLQAAYMLLVCNFSSISRSEGSVYQGLQAAWRLLRM